MEQKTKKKSHIAQSIKSIIGLIFNVIEFILFIRLISKLLGANSANVLIHDIYAVTQPFVSIFEGIFPQFSIQIAGNIGVLEPETIIAMLVIALIAWVVKKIITPHTGSRM